MSERSRPADGLHHTVDVGASLLCRSEKTPLPCPLWLRLERPSSEPAIVFTAHARMCFAHVGRRDSMVSGMLVVCIDRLNADRKELSTRYRQVGNFQRVPGG